jgi:hypothetical protein
MASFPPPPLVPYVGGWEAGSSSQRRARSPSFKDDVDWEGPKKEKEAEANAAQRVLGPKDFIAIDDEAERRAFELAHHLRGRGRGG